MKKVLIFAVILEALVLVFLTVMVFRANAEYVTSDNGLRVRAEPSTEAEIIRVLPYRAEVHGEIEAGWMRLEGEDGYVCADFVSVEDPCDGMQYLGKWSLTGYCWTGYPCANGEYPVAGYSLAHNTLPLGTKLWISGLGERTVTDRGPQYLGNSWADIYMDSYSKAVSWGMQTRDVWLIE